MGDAGLIFRLHCCLGKEREWPCEDMRLSVRRQCGPQRTVQLRTSGFRPASSRAPFCVLACVSFQLLMLGKGNQVLGSVICLVTVEVVNIVIRFLGQACGFLPNNSTFRHIASAVGAWIVRQVQQDMTSIKKASSLPTMMLLASFERSVSFQIPHGAAAHDSRLYSRFFSNYCLSAATAHAKARRIRVSNLSLCLFERRFSFWRTFLMICNIASAGRSGLPATA